MKISQKIKTWIVPCVLFLVFLRLYRTRKETQNAMELLKMENYKFNSEMSKAKWSFTEEDVAFKAFMDGTELEEGVVVGEAYEEIKNNSILPPSARIIAKKIFHKKPLVVWATEWHMTPIKDITNLLTPFGVIVKDYNLDPGRCAWHDCSNSKKLKVLKSFNVLDCSPPLGDKYVKAYANDAEMASVDLAYCGYPASFCQIYLKLNKTVLVQATTRYDVGRYTVDRRNQLNEDYRQLAKNPATVIAGNSKYDAEFIRYYSGVHTYHLPSVCDYTGVDYTNTKPEYLFLRRRDHGFTPVFLKAFKTFCTTINCTVKISEVPKYSFKDLAAYRGVVHIPYQISVMSIFEQYRMNIPMFVPSPQLLAHWQVKHYLMIERSFEGAFFGQRPNKSNIPPHKTQANVPDPKNEFDYQSTLHWMKMADFYQVFPHGIIYKSVHHLVHILQSISVEQLNQISSKMRAYNVEFKKKILRKFRGILLRVAKDSTNQPH